MRNLITVALCLISMVAKAQTEILLVGTYHEFKSELKGRQNFDTVIETIKGFSPDLICIEAIPSWDSASLHQVRKSSLETARQLRV